jgi:hypothetical protein
MSRKRSVMKSITDPWWRYCRTNRENLCTCGPKWVSDCSGVSGGFSGQRGGFVCGRQATISGALLTFLVQLPGQVL